MQTRTRRTIARFRHPFCLTGLEDQPAGDYDIDEDEQIVEGLTWIAWHRVATFIHLPARDETAGNRQMISIDHAELEAALGFDKQNDPGFTDDK